MATEVLVKSIYIYTYICNTGVWGKNIISYSRHGNINKIDFEESLFQSLDMFTFHVHLLEFVRDLRVWLKFFRLLVTRWFIIIWLVFYLWVIPDASCCISKHFLDSLLLNKKSGNVSESQMLNMRIFMNNCLDPALTQGCHIYLYILSICLPVCLSLHPHCVYIISVIW